jgi:hypothetical protein
MNSIEEVPEGNWPDTLQEAKQGDWVIWHNGQSEGGPHHSVRNVQIDKVGTRLVTIGNRKYTIAEGREVRSTSGPESYVLTRRQEEKRKDLRYARAYLSGLGITLKYGISDDKVIRLAASAKDIFSEDQSKDGGLA